MPDADLVIVGSGPAGVATALHLIQRDPSWAARLVILEKSRHPRPKVCGGGITRFGLKQLHNLGLRLQVPYVAIEQASLEYRGQRVSVRGCPMMATVHRPEFDAWLADQARARGIRLLEAHAVEGLESDSEGVSVLTSQGTWRTAAVVGADGSASLVRRWLGGQRSATHRTRLLELVHPASGQEHPFAERTARFLFDDLRRGLHGYYWEFPCLVGGQPHLNAGVYDARLGGSQPRPGLADLLRAHLKTTRQATPRLRSAPLHLFSPFARLARPRALLVGDAAGADPLFGEGIGVGMGYAEVAAEYILQAFRRGDLSFRGYRRRILASPVGKYLLFRYLLAEGCYAWSGSDLFVRSFWVLIWLVTSALGNLPPIADVLPASLPSEPVASQRVSS